MSNSLENIRLSNDAKLFLQLNFPSYTGMVLDHTHPILHEKCSPVEVHSQMVFDPVIVAMYNAMDDYGGVGLAANQLGIPLRIITTKIDDIYNVYINPEIILSPQNAVIDSIEGCLSIPKKTYIVKRWREIEISYTTYSRCNASRCFRCLDSICIQHEIDHLDGRLISDYGEEVI